MQGQDPAGGKRSLAVAEERLFVQRLAGPIGSGRSSAMWSNFSLVSARYFSPSSISTFSLGLSNTPRWIVAEMLLGDLDHFPVEFDQDDLFDRGVLERFLCGSAVAAADDQDALRRRVRGQRRVHQRLVVDELFALGGHETAVEAKELAELRRLVDFQILEARSWRTRGASTSAGRTRSPRSATRTSGACRAARRAARAPRGEQIPSGRRRPGAPWRCCPECSCRRRRRG